ncbi:MAG TPA: cell division protein FtsZ, partial [Gammaproteobacteria bacterium]
TGLGQAAVQQEPIKVIRKSRPRETNYRDFDTPAVQRKHATADEPVGDDDSLQELLDVPAFLRRQAN